MTPSTLQDYVERQANTVAIKLGPKEEWCVREKDLKPVSDSRVYLESNKSATQGRRARTETLRQRYKQVAEMTANN